MERNANYALVGASTLILFMGLLIFAVWLARAQLQPRSYDAVRHGVRRARCAA